MKSEIDLPFVSIVIINYNGMRFLKDCLESVLKTDYPAEKIEVMIVDNGSTDGSLEYIQENFQEVRLIKLSKNVGFAAAANIGASKSRGELVVFLNVDTLVEKNWLIELVRQIVSGPKIAVAGSSVLPMTFKQSHRYVTTVPYLTVLGSVIEIPTKKRKERIFCGSVHGAAFAVRKSIFKRIGGFDSTYFMYSDEVDLCHRAWLYGYEVVICPRSIVYHYGGGIAGGGKESILYSRVSSALRAYFGNRNSLVNIVKNFETKMLIQGLLLSILFTLLLIISPIRKREKALLVRSWCSFLGNLKHFLSERKAIELKRLRSDKWLIKNGLVLDSKKLLKLAFSLMLVNRDNI